jgi:hypothetical protein
MAIASGLPPPPVYLLDDEPGINAFAAGYSPRDAVVGVTRGCVEQLSRDQLQGVIAHEFSHILNGDMRLNIRMIGVIHGIVVVGLIGQTVVRLGLHSPLHSRKKNDGRGALILIGAALAIIGAIGTFFGHLLRAAVSRQREFLADASAVQFTRNPEGIAGALKRIGGYQEGSRVQSPHAPEMTHLFFSEAVTGFFSSLFATHPPLLERIRRIQPGFDGAFLRSRSPEAAHPTSAPFSPPASPSLQPARGFHFAAAPETRSDAHAGRLQPSGGADQGLASQLIAGVGSPTPAHLEHARQLIADLPPALRDAAHDPYGARAILYALLTDAHPGLRAAQHQSLAARVDPLTFKLTQAFEQAIDELGPSYRLLLLELVLPTLRDALSREQYLQTRAAVAELVKADQRVTLFEWMLRHLLLRQLDPAHLGPQERLRLAPQAAMQSASAIAAVIAALAHSGHEDAPSARRAYDTAFQLMRSPAPPMPERDAVGLSELDRALAALESLKPRLKERLLEAAAACVAQDGQVTVAEAELLRAVGAALDCPLPPLLPGKINTPELP